jgi:fructose-bisphosphate aldolase class II
MELRDLLESIKNKNRALLHFNVATYEQFKAGIEATKETKIPLIIGVSEGERNYLGINYIEDLIYEAKEKGINVFLNADHCKSIKSAKEAIDHKFDSVLFDGSELDFKQNILRTKEVVNYRNKISKTTLIEGEIGYLVGHSDIEKIAELKEEYFTDPEVAEEFVNKTKIDLLAISVGNIHGIPDKIKFKGKIYKKPKLDFQRIKLIKEKVKIPLVLHGGSGLGRKDFILAIESGISIIHINTEFRILWKKELLKNLKQKTNVPYKILDKVVEKLKRKIIYYQKLFWNNKC